MTLSDFESMYQAHFGPLPLMSDGAKAYLARKLAAIPSEMAEKIFARVAQAHSDRRGRPAPYEFYRAHEELCREIGGLSGVDSVAGVLKWMAMFRGQVARLYIAREGPEGAHVHFLIDAEDYPDSYPLVYLLPIEHWRCRRNSQGLFIESLDVIPLREWLIASMKAGRFGVLVSRLRESVKGLKQGLYLEGITLKEFLDSFTDPGHPFGMALSLAARGDRGPMKKLISESPFPPMVTLLLRAMMNVRGDPRAILKRMAEEGRD